MSTAAFLTELERLGIRAWADCGRLRFRVPATVPARGMKARLTCSIEALCARTLRLEDGWRHTGWVVDWTTAEAYVDYPVRIAPGSVLAVREWKLRP